MWTTVLGRSEASTPPRLPSPRPPQRAASSPHQFLSCLKFFSVLPFPPARRKESVQALHKERLAPTVCSGIFPRLEIPPYAHEEEAWEIIWACLCGQWNMHGSRRHFLSLCVKHPAPPRSARRKGHSCRSLRVWYGRDTAHRTLYAVTPHRTHRSERWSSSSGSGTERLGHGPHITPLVTCKASTPRPLASEPTPLPRRRAAGWACCVGGRRAPRCAPSRANALVWASGGVAPTSPGGGTRRRSVYGAGPVHSKPGPPRLAFNQRSRGRGLTRASSHCLKGENSPTRTSLACSRSNVSGFVFKEFPPG